MAGTTLEQTREAEVAALEALVKLLESEEENVRLEAAKLILNRTHGF